MSRVDFSVAVNILALVDGFRYTKSFLNDDQQIMLDFFKEDLKNVLFQYLIHGTFHFPEYPGASGPTPKVSDYVCKECGETLMGDPPVCPNQGGIHDAPDQLRRRE